MLEGLIATLMNRFLGMYIKNFDSTQLNVGIWSGDVKLRNLELKKEALDQLKLPLNISEGHLGQLTLQIPWSNLKNKPVKVLIEDVYLLANPKSDQEYDDEEEERRLQVLKQEKLQNAELLQERNTEGMSEEEQQKNQSFMESLTTKILDNLQITVKNIHIRYEDSISTPGHPFALGFTLEEFSAVSTNDDWEPNFIQNNAAVTHKLARLGSLAIYWNTDSEHFGGGSKTPAEIIKAFENLIATREYHPSIHQFVLKPVSGFGRIELNKTMRLDIPRIKAQMLFDEIGFVLDEDQYRDALMMVDLFHFYIRHQQYKKFQPKGVTPKENPRAWLLFATNAVLSQIKEQNRKWSWDYFKERRDDRKRYIELFKKLKMQELLEPTEEEELKKLEWKLSYEDLRFYRSLARNQLRKDRAVVKKPKQEQPQGWVAWMWGSSPQEEEDDDSGVMTEQQRKELYEAIDWDEKQAITETIDLPRETVKMQIEASLKTGSFTLKRDPHGQGAAILSLLFDTFKSKFLQRPDSFYGELSLGGLRVYDGTTEGTLYPQIVRIKDLKPDDDTNRIEELEDSKELDVPREEILSDEPFFQASFEQNPLDGSADSAVTMKMKSMEIIYNPRFVEEIFKFFKPPERHMESIGALMESAGATVEGIRQQTRAGLEFALEEHKTINAKLDLQAPLIIIPESCTEKRANCLILDAGHVSLISELVKKEDIRKVQSKNSREFSEEDYAQLEFLMYDRFLLKLEATQVLIGPSIEETVAQLRNRSDQKNLHIVDRINIDFQIQVSIIPKAPNLTKFRISGHLPVLQASISDKKYKALMKIIDAAIPNLDGDEAISPEQPSQPVPPPRQEPYIDIQTPAVFKFSTQQELVVSDQSDDEDGSEDHFEEASDGMPDTLPSVHQRIFELKFTVDKLQGSLFKADLEGKMPDKELVLLVAEHFQLDFYLRPYDMAAEVLLKSLNVEDFIDEDASQDFKRIITSDGLSKTSNDNPLFLVKYVKVKKESPEFMTAYQAIETNVDVSISTINVVVTRKTVLTLLDFVITTFTNPSAPATPNRGIDVNKGGKGEGKAIEKAPEADKIRVKIDLDCIALILNNDGVRLATLKLDSADVGVFLMGKTMRVGARLGNFSLFDDVNEGAGEASTLRQLVSIQGDELADFQYKTFDPEAGSTYPGYNSSIYLRSGSIKVNFVEEPFRKIIDFAVKFGKMQALYNAARQAAMNQASQIQDYADKIHFDILVRTPIVVFPRISAAGQGKHDLVTAYLGELYAENRFVPLDDSERSLIVNKISAGVRKTRLTSEFFYEEDQSEELELLDKLDIFFAVTYMEHTEHAVRPDLEIEGSMSDLNLKLTQTQFKFLIDLSRSIPTVFAGEPGENITPEQAKDLTPEIIEPSKPYLDSTDGTSETDNVVHLHPELCMGPNAWTKLDLVFAVGSIGMELYVCESDKPIGGDMEAARLSRASLNNTKVKLRMISDGSIESEFSIQSFDIKDSRQQETNKFRKIMSSTNEEGSQFMASVTISGTTEKNVVAILTIDSPRIIFALDYIFALRDYVMFGLEVPAGTVNEALEGYRSDSEVESIASVTNVSQFGKSSQASSWARIPREDKKPQQNNAGMNLSFRLDIVDSQVILIANPGIANSEAIVLGAKRVLISQQHAIALQVEKVGMFLCRMDKFETNRLRILDDFTIKVSMDNRSLGTQSSVQSIEVHVEPLVLRVSLRDILLATQIVHKASEMAAPKGGNTDISVTEPKRIGDRRDFNKLKQKTASGRGVSTVAKGTRSLNTARSSISQAHTNATSTIIKREELTAYVDGMRVILIGDQYELPLLDFSVKNFNINVRDWSGEMDADTSIETFVNIYNFSKSAWEPLIEPWQLGFHMSRATHPPKLSIDLFSHKNLEVTITSQTIALVSKAAQFMQQDEDMLTKPRGVEAPYRIRNQTGYKLNVWAASDSDDGQSMAIKLEDGEQAPWRFEEWEKMRENLSPEGSSGIVGIKLEDSEFESIKEIPVNREGEVLYNLRPAKDGIMHHLLCEVHLGIDNVKYITFRSPMTFENSTQIPVELGILDPTGNHIERIYKILPGESQPAPIEASYHQSVVLRPDAGFGYTWSHETIFWRDVLKDSTRCLTCSSGQGSNSPSFYFQMHANHPKNNPVKSKYPYMKIRLSAPVEVQNLLPYDFKFRIYDKNTRKEWTNFLRKGVLSPVHVVELSHLLLISIDMQDTVFNASEFAIINSNNTEFGRENTLVAKDNQGLELKLKLHYFPIPESGGAFRVAIYSPYVILNKTGLNMMVKSKSLLQQARVAAGQMETDSGSSRKAVPYMFSYPNDDRQNRAVLKVGDSSWSRPQSFEAIGSVSEIVLPSAAKQTEIHIGISVDEGEGKYKMTKVVTLTPRFILKSKLQEDIQIRQFETGSDNIMTLRPGELLPLHFLKATHQKQLTLLFPGINNRWSAPFNISDLGSVHVKMHKANQRQSLIRIDILVEKATVFLHLSMEKKHWPFSMRNESNQEFIFYQADPSEDDDDYSITEFKPTLYRLPPRSIMPYAWDYPAAKNKELVLCAANQTRHVRLAEIGSLIPFKVEAEGPDGHIIKKTIDITVAADGPTQTLILSNYKESKSIYKPKPNVLTSSTASGFEAKDQDTSVSFQAQLQFAGIGISLINRQLKELAYITFRDLELKYNESLMFQTVTLSIKWIQIDNQLYGGIFPIILYPSVVPKTGKEMDVHPSLHASVTRVKDDSYGVLYIKYATFLLQQMTVEIDEDFIYALLDFSKITGASWAEQEDGTLCDDNLDIPEPKTDEAGQDLYFELLNIQPAQLDLSLLRTEVVNVEDKTSSRNPLMFVLNVLTMAMGNVNDAPLRLNALMLENARVSWPVLSQHLQNHYSQEFLYQIHKVLGSADFLGNPVGLFNNISSGVVDIFYEPYQGFIMTDRPQELGIGIAKGATMFVKKSVFGVTDSLSKFTGSISKGLAAATLDKQFQDRRRMSRARNKPKHALYGVTAGANSFVTSFASGIGGLARKPLEGAEKEGALGFFKGIGKGFVGLATKPAIGVFDLASNVTEGIRNTTTVFDAEGLDRVRLTRFIGQDGVVRPYSQREALGQYWLKQLDNGKYFDEEYIAHLELQEQDAVIMLTYTRIMLMRSKKLYSEWDVSLRELQTIGMEKTGIVLTLRGNRQGPFIPTKDESSRKFLFKKIALAVNNFNSTAAGS
ncbi:Vacuolar protein sorting-associated protein 13 [Rhizina undulata]